MINKITMALLLLTVLMGTFAIGGRVGSVEAYTRGFADGMDRMKYKCVIAGVGKFDNSWYTGVNGVDKPFFSFYHPMEIEEKAKLNIVLELAKNRNLRLIFIPPENDEERPKPPENQ